MTRFKKACESPVAMGVMAASLIAKYLEECEVQHFNDRTLTEFLLTIGEDITRWLMEEDE